MAPKKPSPTLCQPGATDPPILLSSAAIGAPSRAAPPRPLLNIAPLPISPLPSTAYPLSSRHRLAVASTSPSPSSPADDCAHRRRPASVGRRDSSSTMRTSSLSLDGGLACTPTGRISKAKKGRRVHACEFPGCGKVFTRAEHRRRHELNHNPEALFPCTRPGCRKAFHRVDLLHRHQERHDLDHAAEVSPNMGHLAPDPLAAEPASALLQGAVMSSPPPHAGITRSSGGLSIGSLVHPQQEYGYGLATPAFNGFARQPLPFVPGVSAADEALFFTPESSQSPVSSEYYGRYNNRQSISSASSVAPLDPHASPLIPGTLPGPWIPAAAPPPPTILPSNMLDDGTFVPVGPAHGVAAWRAYAEADQSRSDSSLPLSLSTLDGYEWTVLRRELSHAPGLRPRPAAAAGISDTIRWHCLDHYWLHFHPHFPVVHRPTFLPTTPSPLLAAAMTALGSQFDPEPDAKAYSLTVLELAAKLLRRRDSITSRSRLADLQTVILLEALSKYCGRRVEVAMSPRFRALVAALDQTRRALATDPLAIFRTLRPDSTADDVARAHQFWLDHETRKRIFQACMVLDRQQVHLFEQPATVVEHARSRKPPGGVRSPLSLPCADELWETSPIGAWAEKAAHQDNVTVTATGDLMPWRLDAFQLQVHIASNSALSSQWAPPEHAPATRSTSHHLFNHHMRKMTGNTPIRQLLVVSGESWVLGSKLEDEAEFREATRRVRAWVDARSESRVAVWHASQLIRSRAQFATAATATELSVSFDDTHMLHEPWTLFLAALVCWAYGSSADRPGEPHGDASGPDSVASDAQSSLSWASTLSPALPPLLDAYEAACAMRDYLQWTNVPTPDDLLRVDSRVFAQVHGLLESVRLKKVADFTSGLMNEAERVLYRLVDRRHGLPLF